MKNVEAAFSDLRKVVEKEKVEQEKLRKIQVLLFVILPAIVLAKLFTRAV